MVVVADTAGPAFEVAPVRGNATGLPALSLNDSPIPHLVPAAPANFLDDAAQKIGGLMSLSFDQIEL